MNDMHEISVINASGDNKLLWDPQDAAGVQAAKNMYDELTKKGYAAFGVKQNGEKAGQIDHFSKDLARIILVPPMRGG